MHFGALGKSFVCFGRRYKSQDKSGKVRWVEFGEADRWMGVLGKVFLNMSER